MCALTNPSALKAQQNVLAAAYRACEPGSVRASDPELGHEADERPSSMGQPMFFVAL